MCDINRVMGLGFDMFVISPEEIVEHGYECMFYKIVPEDEPISSDFCDDPVRFGIATEGYDGIAVMCHAHFQQFASDMMEACIILADEGTLERDPKIAVNTERQEAVSMHAIVHVAAHFKYLKGGAN